MNFNEYKEKAKTTCLPESFNLEYLSLGLVNEAIEAFEKVLLKCSDEEMLKELGDVCWYVALLAELLDIEIVEQPAGVSPIAHAMLVVNAGDFAGLAKKNIRDGKLNMEKASSILNSVYGYIIESCLAIDYEIGDALKSNIDKLFSRKERGVLKGSGDNR